MWQECYLRNIANLHVEEQRLRLRLCDEEALSTLPLFFELEPTIVVLQRMHVPAAAAMCVHMGGSSVISIGLELPPCYYATVS